MSQDQSNQEVSNERKDSELVQEEAMLFSASAKTYYLAFLDDGHGLWDTPGKRTPVIPEFGRSIRENEFNSAVVDLIATKLKPLGIIPILVAPGDKDTPLKTRTNFANSTYKSYQNKYGISNVKAVYVSVHYDAMGSIWSAAEGNSIFVYNGQINKNSGKLAASIGEFLRQGTKQKWRGIREENFHVLRETTMPACLTENGFMSNLWESTLMLNKSFQSEVATEHAKGIAKYFNVSYKDSVKPTTPDSGAQKESVTTGTSSHKIVKGDTYTKLANNYKVTVDELKKANPSVDPTKLQIGQTIKIPKASSTSTKPATPTKKPSNTTTTRKIGNIKIVGDIKIVNVKNAAWIVDKPSSNSKNLATISLGKTLPIAGSVPDWWEVVYSGKRCYVNKKYGKMI